MSARYPARVDTDRSAAEVPKSTDYATLRDAIANDLEAFQVEGPVAAAKLVADLADEIQACLDRGATRTDVAKIFAMRGVQTTPDAIRMAQRRSTSSPLPQRRKAAATQIPSGDRAEAVDIASKHRGPRPDLDPFLEQASATPVASSPPPGSYRAPSIGRRLD